MFDRPVAYRLHTTARDNAFLEENVKIRTRAVQADILARVSGVCGRRLIGGSSAASRTSGSFPVAADAAIKPNSRTE